MFILKKENGVVSRFNTFGEACVSDKCHLCGDCKNLDPNVCSKVEIYKKQIGEYDYITDGYQVYVKKVGEEQPYLQKFVVSGCKGYEQEGVKVKDSKAMEKRKALMNMFYEAENFEEACAIRENRLARNEAREQNPVQRVRKYTPNL